MVRKKTLTDRQLMSRVAKANGNYYDVAHEIGEQPVRTGDRLLRMDGLSEELRGRILVYREEGARLQNARRLTKENNKLRRELRAATDFSNMAEDIAKAFKRKDYPKRSLKEESKALRFAPDDRPTEWLFSDLHFGKTCEGYSPQVAESRVEQYADAIKIAHKRIHPTHTTIAFLGDLIENANKHRDSQTGSAGMTTAEQIVGATRLCKKFLDRVLPTCGRTVDIVGVCGNHENPYGAGASMASPGAAHFTHVIYSHLADCFEGWVANSLSWHIPRGNYARINQTVYEHGDDTQPTDKSMNEQMVKRSRQCGQFITRYRQGDKHVAVAADGVNMICNGAFYSDRNGTEYSGIKGYASIPTQVGVLPNRVVEFVRLA